MPKQELLLEISSRREMIQQINELIKISNNLELFATFFIFLVCLFIYFKIHSFYKLTNHKGINYFQKGFLFFSLSYLISFIQVMCKTLHFPIHFQYPLFFTLIGIFYLLGISYLLSSMFSKYIKEWHILISIPLITIIGIILHTRTLIAIYSLTLICLFGYISYLKLKENKTKHKKVFSNIYIIYLLIFLSWVIQIASRIIIEIEFIAKFIYLISSALIFSYIFYIVYQKIMKSGD